MKVCIVGAGAVGGVLGGWLGAGPQAIELSALARGATLQALRSQGLLVESGSSAPTLRVPVHASDQAEELGRQDLVIVAVKAPALAAVAPAVQALSGPDTTVLVAMNGLPWWFFDALSGPCQGLALQSIDPGGFIRRHLPTGQVVGCVVHFSSTVPRPGVARHVIGERLIVGEALGGASARLQHLAGVLQAAGFAVNTSECIQRDIWFKLWGNMTMNPVSALTGADSAQILDDPLVRGFLSAVMLEAREIGARIGLPIEQDPEDRHAVTRKLGAFRTSMLQDLEAGRALEIDALVGAVKEVGTHLGLSTPNLDALFGLVRLLGRSRGLYGAGA